MPDHRDPVAVASTAAFLRQFFLATSAFVLHNPDALDPDELSMWVESLIKETSFHMGKDNLFFNKCTRYTVDQEGCRHPILVLIEKLDQAMMLGSINLREDERKTYQETVRASEITYLELFGTALYLFLAGGSGSIEDIWPDAIEYIREDDYKRLLSMIDAVMLKMQADQEFVLHPMYRLLMASVDIMKESMPSSETVMSHLNLIRG
jgi:hypothetical protein